MICSTDGVDIDKNKKNFSLRNFFSGKKDKAVGSVLDDKKRRHYHEVVRGWIKEKFDHVLVEMVDLGLVHETIGL